MEASQFIIGRVQVFFFWLLLFFIYLAALSLSYSVWQPLNPGPLPWELSVLANGPSGKSQRVKV